MMLNHPKFLGIQLLRGDWGENVSRCTGLPDGIGILLMTVRSVKVDLRHSDESRDSRGEAAGETAPRIGPNSLIQTWRALSELENPAVLQRVAEQAQLPDPLPGGMVPEAWFCRLIQALRHTLPPGRSEAVLRRSGSYTAAYVGRHRIPAPIRWVLAALPARLAIPLLLAAFRRHAWTFAGAGRFSVEGAFPGTLVLDGCPTCRDTAVIEGAGGAYYEAAFEGLLSLAARRVRVREVACQGSQAPVCRFQISFHDLTPGAAPCASS
jgi:divinyl protochlorophyllide a 8-vinyl-reductase